jgi:UDP-glucose 4-epimerase
MGYILATYLITGGAGFIGSHLTAFLQRAGHKVRVLDDMSTGKPERLSTATKIIWGSVTDPLSVQRAMTGVDACFHLAAVADVQHCERNWHLTHAANAGGTVNVFETASRMGGLPVVWASSAAVYGAVDSEEKLSETNTPAPIGAYGADKLASELYGHVAAKRGVPNVGLRFFNVFGGGQDPKSPYSGVLSIFCDRYINRDRITVFGDGEQTRDFIHISDVIRALVASLTYLETRPAAENASIFNVCSGRQTSLNAILNLLEVVGGYTADIVHVAERAGDIRASCGDPAKMNAELGIHAEVSLADGLQELIQFLDAPQYTAKLG